MNKHMHTRSNAPAVVAFLLIALGTAPSVVRAQHDAEATNEEHGHHELTLLLAHTHLRTGITSDGKAEWLVLPSWGINYNYWINSKWAIGLHTDFITETFLVKEDLDAEHSEEVLERSHPIAPAIMATYRPHHHWAFILGAGEEFAEEGNLFLMRAGTEYAVHLSGAWETSGSLAYDFRFNAYDSFTLGVGLTHAF